MGWEVCVELLQNGSGWSADAWGRLIPARSAGQRRPVLGKQTDVTVQAASLRQVQVEHRIDMDGVHGGSLGVFIPLRVRLAIPPGTDVGKVVGIRSAGVIPAV